MSASSADPGAPSPGKDAAGSGAQSGTAAAAESDPALAFLDLRGPHEPLDGDRARELVKFSVEPRREAGTLKFVKRVALSGWGFDADAAKVVAHELQQLPGLEHVEFSDVGSGRTDSDNIAVFTVLSEALSPASRAKALGCEPTDERAQLVNIDISDNAVGIGAIERWRSLLSGNQRLQRISLNNCGLSGVAMEAVNKILLRPAGETVADVAAGTDGDGGEFAKAADPGAAAGGAGEAEAGAKEAVPAKVRDMGGVGVPTRLRAVQLHNNMGGNDGAEAAAALVRASPELRLFRFASTRGRSEGGEELLSAVSELRHLEHLDVSDNMFKSEKCRESLVNIVKGPSADSLRVLKLSDLQMGDATAKQVLEALLTGGEGGGASCPRLEALFLGGNDITAGGGASKLLVRAARELPQLRLLSVPNNELEWVVGGPLADAIRSRPAGKELRVLDVSGNGLGSASITEVACALASGAAGAEAVAAAKKEEEALWAAGEAEGEPEGGEYKAGTKSARAMTTREKDEAELDVSSVRFSLDDNTCSEKALCIARKAIEGVAGGKVGTIELLDLFDDEEENEEEREKIADKDQWDALMVEDE